MLPLVFPFFVGILIADIAWAEHSGFSVQPTPTKIVQTFSYFFTTDGVVEETESPEKSSSPYWWLNSGGQFIIKYGKGSTLSKNFLVKPTWRAKYNMSNPVDTDNGLHPQNIFRLVTKKKWQNAEQNISFKIQKINESKSENRNESNGVFLMSRYQDHNNLYYAGIRVDGSAIIKKKLNGVYTTLAQQPFFEDSPVYDREKFSNLLPLSHWIGLKTITKNIENGVLITLFIDKDNTGSWEKVLEVKDSTEFFSEENFVGIRTDFMDVEFDNFFIQSL